MERKGEVKEATGSRKCIRRERETEAIRKCLKRNDKIGKGERKRLEGA
jgi:hypothetical protein